MNDNLDFIIDKTKFPEGSEFSFMVKYFGNEIVAARTFSNDNAISYNVTNPGIYQVDAIIKSGTSLTYTNLPYTYFSPKNTYDLHQKSDQVLIDKVISRARTKSSIECFRADFNSQIHDFIYFPSHKQNLFVLCPSAIIRGKFPVPYFYRWSWAADGKFPGNVIVMSDPSFLLDPALRAGWLVGTRENDATINFTSIINIFCKALKIPFKNIVFWGSSAGGFIAMQLCKYFPGSAAVAVNAQTDIYKFEAYEKLYRIGFPDMSDEEINIQYPERLTTLANIHKFRRNRIFMVQNIQDTHHYENHFKPFMRILMNKPEPELPEGIWNVPGTGFTGWVYSSPNGHDPETEEMAQVIIKRLGY